MWSDDPERDADEHDMEEEDNVSKLPVCVSCGEHITTEDPVHITVPLRVKLKGKKYLAYPDAWICEDCLNGMRESTDRFLD
ncbi:MAG: hypothetical protein LKJ76_04775 [Lachnospiraceae bacterium]|jgi:hypothetical protein|nr:hypothetical protein [Lachnospiraceae bacterium]